MRGLLRSIERRGGIARTCELLDDGWWPEIIRIASDYGVIVRVRKGWYALPGVDKRAIEARRIGGRLACVSALVHHGELPAHEGPLHVEVVATAARLRNPGGAVIHWAKERSHDGARDGDHVGTRLAVTVQRAAAQAARCTRYPVHRVNA
jgi:hypothetical protein